MASDLLPSKRKSNALSPPKSGAHPAKRAKFLDDDDADFESDIEQSELKINQDYARRFEYNKKRAELHRLEEKYGRSANNNSHHESEGSTSDDETEDEDGELADEAIDAEISATLHAIRSKDPRIYSKSAKFFSENQATAEIPKVDKDKPLYLRDYHRKNLLENGHDPEATEDHHLPYAMEQAVLKNAIVDEINAAAQQDSDDQSGEDAFLVKKNLPAAQKTKASDVIPDPKTADENPEAFLSNFFASRAWIPTDTSNFQPLESDNDEDDAKAEEFENAWNLRFEDPETSNKFLTTHSREVVAKYSVRREQTTGRRKAREIEKEDKLAEKRAKEAERKRYKNLKMQDMEGKLQKIRDAAGFSGKDVNVEDWADMLEADWDDDKWNEEMLRRFGNGYYEAEEESANDDGHQLASNPKKPKWDDDIDIGDIVTDLDDDPIVKFQLTDDEDGDSATDSRTNKTTKSDVRRDRRIIEALADQQIPFNMETSGSKGYQPFRYRDTSPNSFGLSPLDILAADDSQLNQYAGLKKLATFRDPERKNKDKSKLSKKARLRAWRKETFGREDGPAPGMIFAPEVIERTIPKEDQDDVEDRPPNKKRKRRRKSKVTADAA